MTLGIALGDGDRLPARFGMHLYYNFFNEFHVIIGIINMASFLPRDAMHPRY